MIRRLFIFTAVLVVPAFISRLHSLLPSPLDAIVHNARHSLFGDYAPLYEHLSAGIGMVFFCSAVLIYFFIRTENGATTPEWVRQVRMAMQRFPVTYRETFVLVMSAWWVIDSSYYWEVERNNIALKNAQLDQIAADLAGMAIGVALVKFMMIREWRGKAVTR